MPRKRGKIGEYTEAKDDELIELMEQGLLNCEIIALWDISDSIFYRWLKTYPSLQQAYEIGLPKCEAALVKRFRQMADGTLEGKHSFNALIALANNKFHWAKDSKVETSTNIQIGQVNILQNQTKDQLIDFIKTKVKDLEVIDVDFESRTLQQLPPEAE